MTYLFLERGGEGERERNINVWLPLAHPLQGTWPATQACALDFGSQAGTQCTEPRQPAPSKHFDTHVNTDFSTALNPPLVFPPSQAEFPPQFPL